MKQPPYLCFAGKAVVLLKQLHKLNMLELYISTKLDKM